MRRLTSLPLSARGRWTGSTALALATSLSWAEAPGSAALTPPNPSDPVYLEADHVTYDLPHQTLTAHGRVHSAVKGYRILADHLTIHEKTGAVHAHGSLQGVDPKGALFFAEDLTLTDHLSHGVLRNVQARLPDHSRLVARRAERTSPARTIYQDVQYTPCLPCQTNPDQPPLWSAHAKKVVHDKAHQNVTYHDVKLRVLGVPILYSPYLSHPDNSVTRKSGWLAPSSSLSKNLGFYAAAPYYWALAPNRDLTITPHVTTKLGVVLDGHLRHLTRVGLYALKGSITRDDLIISSAQPLVSQERRVRWHVDGYGDFAVSPHLSLKLDVQRASDQTYLKRFRFFELWNKANLTSSARLDYFDDRRFGRVRVDSYQGLHEAYATKKIPTLLPSLQYETRSAPLALWGGTGTLNVDYRNLTRVVGAETQRFVTSAEWLKPILYTNGMVTDWTLKLRHDIYHIQNYDPNDPDYFSPFSAPAGTMVNGTRQRFFPQIAWHWRYPWIQHFARTTVVVQPVVQVVAAPNLAPNLAIPNEDSRLFELDESNIFATSRVTGYDLLDAGSRVTVGGQFDALTNDLQASFFLGQSLWQTPNRSLGVGSGIDTRRSDYLARLNLAHKNGLRSMLRLRLDEQTLSLKSTDIALRVGPKAFEFQTHYFFLNPNAATSTSGSREQITLGARSALSDTVTVYGSTTRDLGSASQTLQFSAGMNVKNDCLSLSTEVYRSLLQDRDVRPDLGFRFKIILKNFSQDSSSTSEDWSLLTPTTPSAAPRAVTDFDRRFRTL